MKSPRSISNYPLEFDNGSLIVGQISSEQAAKYQRDYNTQYFSERRAAYGQGQIGLAIAILDSAKGMKVCLPGQAVRRVA